MKQSTIDALVKTQKALAHEKSTKANTLKPYQRIVINRIANLRVSHERGLAAALELTETDGLFNTSFNSDDTREEYLEAIKKVTGDDCWTMERVEQDNFTVPFGRFAGQNGKLIEWRLFYRPTV